MKLTRISIGQALRSAREAAGLTLVDLAALSNLSVSALSRSERGERDLSYSEAVQLCAVLKFEVTHFQALANTFERLGASAKKEQISNIERDLLNLQKTAIQLVLEARSGTTETGDPCN